jgi:hypothetical protein
VLADETRRSHWLRGAVDLLFRVQPRRPRRVPCRASLGPVVMLLFFQFMLPCLQRVSEHLRTLGQKLDLSLLQLNPLRLLRAAELMIEAGRSRCEIALGAFGIAGLQCSKRTQIQHRVSRVELILKLHRALTLRSGLSQVVPPFVVVEILGHGPGDERPENRTDDDERSHGV